MLSKPATMILAAAATVAAQNVIVIVESSHSGAGNGLMNKSITVPLDTIYTDPALDAVSTLYLTQAEGVALSSVTCTPFRDTDGTGNAGLAFTKTSPSFISTNTEQIGSLLCNSTAGAGSSSSLASITSTISAFDPPIYPPYPNASTTAPNATSVLLTTVSDPATGSPSTFTSIATVNGDSGPTTSTYTSIVNVVPTTSAEASLNSEGAAPTKHIASWVAGAAVAGFGLVAAL